MPLEMMTSDQMLIDPRPRDRRVRDRVRRPSDELDQLVLVAAGRADLVLMVTELRVASLHRARRQLDLLASAGPGQSRRADRLNRDRKGLLRTSARRTRSGC